MKLSFSIFLQNYDHTVKRLGSFVYMAVSFLYRKAFMHFWFSKQYRIILRVENIGYIPIFISILDREIHQRMMSSHKLNTFVKSGHRNSLAKRMRLLGTFLKRKSPGHSPLTAGYLLKFPITEQKELQIYKNSPLQGSELRLLSPCHCLLYFFNHFDLLSYLLNSMCKQLLESTPCLLYTSPSPRDLSTSRMPSSA